MPGKCLYHVPYTDITHMPLPIQLNLDHLVSLALIKSPDNQGSG